MAFLLRGRSGSSIRGLCVLLAGSLICIAGKTGRSRSISLGIRGLLRHLPCLTRVSIRIPVSLLRGLLGYLTCLALVSIGISISLLRGLLGHLACLPLIPIRIPVSLLGRLILRILV